MKKGNEPISTLLVPRLLDVTVPWAQIDPSAVIYASCILCGSSRYEGLASVVINRMEFFIVRCLSCGLLWRNPIPDKSFLHNLYSEAYYNVAAHSPSLIYQVGIGDSLPTDQTMRRRIAQAEVDSWVQRRILPMEQEHRKKLLEVGGGRGYLQQAAAERGWDTTGLEISSHGIKEAITRGLVVLPITLDELCDKYIPYSQYFDIIVCFDLLEHVSDPGRVLRAANFILKDDGIIILRVPIGDNCPTLHLIDHIWHFSCATLEMLLIKEGFEIFSQHPSGQFQDPHGKTINNITLFANKCQ